MKAITSRRAFLAKTLPMPLTATVAARWPGGIGEAPPAAPPAVEGAVKPVVPFRAVPLPLTAVRLTGGPLKRAQDLDGEYLLKLEPDRMLAFYRLRAGLEPKAPGYAGWDADGRQLTGHIAGHHLSAVGYMYGATGDAGYKQRADYIVNELKTVQDKQGDGFAGALLNVKEAFAEVAKGNIRSAAFDLNGLWSPWYTLHKTYAGLRDAYRYTGNRTALDIEIRFAEWAERVLAPMTETDLQRMLNTEFGGMPEVLADLYADTGDRRWLALSHKFDHHAVLDPLERHEDPLNGLHGNTQVPKIMGSLVRFIYTGDAGDGFAAGYFWDRVAHHHSFATGGHGKDEYFREPDRLSAIVDGRTAESCNVYNMIKMARQLFALRPSIEYAEFHERALFNHILGSIDPGDGSTCYMVPVGRGVRREYQNMFQSFTCCVGSGMESHALHGHGIYYESGDRLWVNLYAPTTAEWTTAGVRVATETTFPEGDAAELTFTAAQPKPFTLALRRPSWAGSGFSARVNGQEIKDLPPPGSYVEIARTWKTGDKVSLTLPKALRVEPTPDNPKRAAILWGPLVMAGDLGPEPARGGGRGGGAPAPPPATPVFVAPQKNVSEWLKPIAGKPGAFQSDGVGRDRDLDFVPFYRLHRRVYSSYFDIVTTAEWDKMRTDAAAEEARQKRFEANSVADLRPGADADKQFHQQGEQTSTAQVQGRQGRTGRGWFSYDLPIDPSRPLGLVVTYHSDNRRARTFIILVDGKNLASQSVDQSSESRFFDVEYPVPEEMVRGKQQITVRFEATNGNDIATVFGIRVIRADK